MLVKINICHRFFKPVTDGVKYWLYLFSDVSINYLKAEVYLKDESESHSFVFSVVSIRAVSQGRIEKPSYSQLLGTDVKVGQ